MQTEDNAATLRRSTGPEDCSDKPPSTAHFLQQLAHAGTLLGCGKLLPNTAGVSHLTNSAGSHATPWKLKVSLNLEAVPLAKVMIRSSKWISLAYCMRVHLRGTPKELVWVLGQEPDGLICREVLEIQGLSDII